MIKGATIDARFPVMPKTFAFLIGISEHCRQAGSRVLTDVDRATLHVGCWFVIGAFIASTALYAKYMRRFFAEADVWCGNALTDPLRLLLEGGVPIAAVAVIGLTILRRIGAVERRSVIIAAILVTVCTAALIAFGAHIYKYHLAGVAALSDEIWWMTPMWKWFGI